MYMHPDELAKAMSFREIRKSQGDSWSTVRVHKEIAIWLKKVSINSTELNFSLEQQSKYLLVAVSHTRRPSSRRNSLTRLFSIGYENRIKVALQTWAGTKGQTGIVN
ncbi:hypothetical protein ScPMuIL_004864 [Solemya velum]